MTKAQPRARVLSRWWERHRQHRLAQSVAPPWACGMTWSRSAQPTRCPQLENRHDSSRGSDGTTRACPTQGCVPRPVSLEPLGHLPRSSTGSTLAAWQMRASTPPSRSRGLPRIRHGLQLSARGRPRRGSSTSTSRHVWQKLPLSQPRYGSPPRCGRLRRPLRPRADSRMLSGSCTRLRKRSDKRNWSAITGETVRAGPVTPSPSTTSDSSPKSAAPGQLPSPLGGQGVSAWRLKSATRDRGGLASSSDGGSRTDRAGSVPPTAARA
jgi:hypothetical protein